MTTVATASANADELPAHSVTACAIRSSVRPKPDPRLVSFPSVDIPETPPSMFIPWSGASGVPATDATARAKAERVQRVGERERLVEMHLHALRPGQGPD